MENGVNFYLLDLYYPLLRYSSNTSGIIYNLKHNNVCLERCILVVMLDQSLKHFDFMLRRLEKYTRVSYFPSNASARDFL
jgi:hypothetical protein